MKSPLAVLLVLAAGASGDAAAAVPWSDPYRIDPARPHHFVRPDGRHLFLFNKTAWLYFAAREPRITVERARALGTTVLRAGLECAYYQADVGLDAWPWGGSRSQPDFSTFNEDYWARVEERLRLAAAHGLGFNLTLFTTLHLPDQPESFARVEPYLARVIARLAPHPNIFCWEVHNEHTSNPGFQRQVGEYLRRHDPHRRPVISSPGTTDAPLWPEAPWMDMAVLHHCTGNQPQYDLRDWYLAIARNLRGYGKPAFNNETGRERRHRNDDPVHRRKQLWLAAAAGNYTTWHSWDGCEGIDDATSVAPGQEFVAPFARWWSAQEFWTVNPDHTAVQLPPDDPRAEELLPVVLASPTRERVLAYFFTRTGGARVTGAKLQLRLPNGDYRVEWFVPATGAALGAPAAHVARGPRPALPLPVPDFTDDLALRLTRTVTRNATALPGTR